MAKEEKEMTKDNLLTCLLMPQVKITKIARWISTKYYFPHKMEAVNLSLRLVEIGRRADGHMLSRQPTFQLSDRVSHELKVICRLIDGAAATAEG